MRSEGDEGDKVLVSRTRCSVLHDAPQSGDLPNGVDDGGPRISSGPLRCAASGERQALAELTPLIQPAHDVIELLEFAVADVHGSAGIAVIDADR
jgi:hypothetical protein